MLLTRRRSYYLLRDLECASCRSKKGTRIFINGERMLDDCEIDRDVDVVEVLCINCAHKAARFVDQSKGRREHINEAFANMHLREAAKIPTRYDAYRLPTKEPLTPYDVHKVMERFPCEVCKRTDDDFFHGRERQAIRGLLMWPDQKANKPPYDTIEEQIDQYRDLVWICPNHVNEGKKLRLSWSFDENFYRLMNTLYS